MTRLFRHRGSVAAVLLGQAGAAVGVAVATRILTECASPAALGGYKLAVGIVVLCSGILFTPYVQFVMREYHEAALGGNAAAFLGHARRSLLKASVMAAPAAVFALIVYALFAGQPSLRAALAAGPLIVVHAAFSFQNGVLVTGDRQAAASTIRSAMQTSIPIAAAGGAVLFGSRGESLVAGELLVLSALYLVTTRLARLEFTRPSKEQAANWSAAARSFALPLYAVGISGWVLAVSDRYILAAWYGAAEVGKYAAAYALGSQPIMMLTGVAAQVLYPFLFRAAAASRVAAQREMLHYMALGTATCAAVVLVAVAAVGDHLIALLLAAPFRGGAYGILLWVAGAYSLLSVASSLEMRGYAGKRTAPMGRSYLCAAVANLTASLLLIPREGALGAAKATFAGYLVYLIAMAVHQVRRADPASVSTTPA